jgi:peptidoglycan/LPS O-acetylase OafA/YrhL
MIRMNTKVPFGYKPQLDGVRAICVLFTIFNHVPGTPSWVNGGVGVDVFFALSGFLITSLMVVERAKTGRTSLRGFYFRRFFRIVPLYLVAFMATGFAAWVLGFSGDASKFQQFLHLWPWVLTFNRELCPLNVCGATLFGHAWTIGIEEKFYVIFPLLFVCWRSAKALCFVLALVGFIVAVALPIDMLRGYVGIIFGCLFALLTYGRNFGSGFSDFLCLLVMALGYCIATFWQMPEAHLIISFASAYLISSMAGSENSRLSRLLGAKWLAWAGTLTYGIYLFHVLTVNALEIMFSRLPEFEVKWLVRGMFAYVLTFILAHFLHRFIEQPFIKWGRELAQPR